MLTHAHTHTRTHAHTCTHPSSCTYYVLSDISNIQEREEEKKPMNALPTQYVLLVQYVGHAYDYDYETKKKKKTDVGLEFIQGIKAG